MAHFLDDREAVAQVGQRLDVAGAEDRFIGGAFAAHHFGVEVADVTLRHRPVLAQARAAGP